MANYRFLVGSIAFSISFGTGLLIHHDVGKALATGFTTLPATLVAVAIADRQFYQQAADRIVTLKSHIRALQRQRAETYQSLVEISAEREQAALALSSMHLHHNQPRVPVTTASSVLPPARQPISWDLSVPMVLEPTILTSSPAQSTAEHQLSPTLIQNRRSAEVSLKGAPSNAVATKQTLQTNLASLQAEFSQLKHQLEDQRQKKDKLTQEVTELKQQKRQLETQSKALWSEMQDLEQQRGEAKRLLAIAETRKQALEATSISLQATLTSLQAELHSLENQVQEWRQQKEALEEQLTALKVVTASQPPPAVATELVTSSIQPQAPPPLPDPPEEQSTQELSEEWTELMVQLPEYEFQVLKVITESSKPVPSIKKIAEENLTMPELLIDAINERALETIGDLLIDVPSGVSSAAIAPEHNRTIKKLLKAYEELLQWEKG
jgi:chromosome segregation ATPase